MSAHNPKIGGSNPPATKTYFLSRRSAKPRNHGRHCRNTVAFASYKSTDFLETAHATDALEPFIDAQTMELHRDNESTLGQCEGRRADQTFVLNHPSS